MFHEKVSDYLTFKIDVFEFWKLSIVVIIILLILLCVIRHSEVNILDAGSSTFLCEMTVDNHFIFLIGF